MSPEPNAAEKPFFTCGIKVFHKLAGTVDFSKRFDFWKGGSFLILLAGGCYMTINAATEKLWSSQPHSVTRVVDHCSAEVPILSSAISGSKCWW